MVSASPSTFAAVGPASGSPRFELLTLGDELLLGLTANSHLTWIGAELGRRGVQLAHHATLSDGADDIAAQLRVSWARATVVIVTGGLGPTCDDRTREAAAAALGEALVHDAAIEHAIAERFARFGRPMTPNNRQQAMKFAHGEVLPNSHGTAPGLWLARDGRVLALLPGPPNELRPMFAGQVIPRLVRLGLLTAGEAYVQFRTAGIGESALETRLAPDFAPYGDNLGIAYCAHDGHVDVRLSSPDGRLTFAQLEELAAACAARLGEDFLCHGRDSLAKVCADLLRARDKRLAVAEAATGGLLASSFSDLCGACKFFAGGVVCCSNDAKLALLEVPECLLLQHGAVSGECAVAMATAVAERLGADYALAVTGSASPGSVSPLPSAGGRPGDGGPEGGAEENPLGAIYLALHTPHGAWAKRVCWPGARATVKTRAVNAALDWLRRELLRT
ncbi:MAG: CinA family nicotinamide mononucleotide deamidase-related protein [Verrucomicrobiota bacterium]